MSVTRARSWLRVTPSWPGPTTSTSSASPAPTATWDLETISTPSTQKTTASSTKTSETYSQIRSNITNSQNKYFWQVPLKLCFECETGITDDGLLITDVYYHLDCFKCYKCSTILDGTYFTTQHGHMCRSVIGLESEKRLLILIGCIVKDLLGGHAAQVPALQAVDCWEDPPRSWRHVPSLLLQMLSVQH